MKSNYYKQDVIVPNDLLCAAITIEMQTESIVGDYSPA